MLTRKDYRMAVLKTLSLGLCLGLCGSLAACSQLSSHSEERRLSVLRPVPRDLKTVEIRLSRDKLNEALTEKVSLEALRIVEIFSSVTPGGDPLPRYRIFGVMPGSVYRLMGLENADIIVGMNDRILANPAVFKAAVQYLPQEKQSELEIVRNSTPMLLRYVIEG